MNVMKWWLFWLALINRKIEQRYYKKRRQHLHRIYVRWEKEDPKEREAYRKWKPKAIEAFNTVREREMKTNEGICEPFL